MAKVAITEAGMSDSGLEQLATQLGRPVQSLAAFERLTPEQRAFLTRAIGEARERERRAMESVPGGTLPGPLRRLLLWLLGWRQT